MKYSFYWHVSWGATGGAGAGGGEPKEMSSLGFDLILICDILEAVVPAFLDDVR